MVQSDTTIINKLGLHARASGVLTQTVTPFKSDVWIIRNGRRVNAKSIMGVMMLAAGMGQQWQSGIRHALPKPPVAWQSRVDIVAIWQTLHHHGSRFKAAVEFLQRVRPGGMNGDGREQFRMLPAYCKKVVIGDVEGTERELLPVFIIDFLVGQQHGMGNGTFAQPANQQRNVSLIKSRGLPRHRKPDLLEHPVREQAVHEPWLQPASVPSKTVAHKVDMHVNGSAIVRGNSNHRIRTRNL